MVRGLSFFWLVVLGRRVTSEPLIRALSWLAPLLAAVGELTSVVVSILEIELSDDINPFATGELGREEFTELVVVVPSETLW